MLKISQLSYGATAAVVISMAIISGLDAANATKSVIISAILIAAVADNLTDALSIHIFQESRPSDHQDAFAGTITNFIARFVLCISFIPIVELLPLAQAVVVGMVWGMFLLATITYFVARERQVNKLSEVIKHLVVAVVVLFASNVTGSWINKVLN